MRRALTMSLPVFLPLVALIGCGGGGPTPPTQVTQVTVASVSVSPATASGRAGDAAQQFTATATMSNATTQTVTTQAAWVSSNEQVATVAASGLVTPRAAGDADIRATYQGATGTGRISVTTATPTPPTGLTISGRVREQGTSAAISGATVIIKDTAFTTVSDSAGSYSFTGVSTGNFVLRATKAGYQLTEVPVTVGTSVTVDISMPATASSPVAAFTVIPDSGTIATGEQCEVQQEGAANRLKCTFDASSSSAAGGVTGYSWSFPVPNQANQTFSGVRLSRPTLPCGSFPGTSDREVILTITHAGGSTSVTRMVTYRRNGPC